MARVTETVVNLVIGAKDRTSRVLKKVNDNLKSLRLNAVAAGAAIASAFAGLASGSFLRSAIGSAAEFEQAMAKVRSVLSGDQQSVEQAFNRIEAKADELGRTTSFSATQAAESMEELIRAGLSASEAIGAVPAVLNASIGASISLAESAARITDVAANLGLVLDEQGETAARIADVISKTAATSATTFAQASDAVVRAGQAARIAGVEFDELSGLVGILANNGLRAAESGTALRNLFNELQNPASKARKELAKLGSTSSDVFEVLDVLSQSGPKAQQALRGFTIEARTAAQILLNQGVPAIREYIGTVDDSADASKDAANIVGNTLQGAFKALASAYDAAQRALAKPLLEPIANGVRELADEISKFVQGGGLNEFSKALLEAFTNARKAVIEFFKTFDTKAALKSVGEFASGVVTAVSGVVSSVRFAANSITVVIEGIASVVNSARAAFAWLRGNTEEFNRLNEKVEENVRKVTEASRSLNEQLFGNADVQEKLADSSNKAADGADRQAAAVERLNEQLEQAEGNTREALETYRRLLEAGADDATLTKALQAYTQSLAEGTQQARRLKDAVELVAVESGEAAEASLSIEEAFKRLGVVSEEQTQTLIDSFRQAFERIRDDADSTTADISRAFLSLSQRQLEAAKALTRADRERVQEQLRQEAATIGVTEQLERQINRAERGLKIDQQRLEEAKKRAEVEQSLLSLQERLARAQGNDTEALRLRQLQERKSLESQILEARLSGDQQTALSLQNELALLKEVQGVEFQNVQQQQQAAQLQKEAQEAAAAAAEQQAQQQREAAAAAADLAASAGFVNQIIGIQEERLGALSERAKEAFENSLTGGALEAADALDSTDEKLQNVNDRVIEAIRLQNSASNGAFTQIAGFYQQLSAEIELATLRQKAAVEQLIAGINTGSQAAFAQLQSIGTDIDSLRNRFNLLDDTDLNNLLNNLQAVNNSIDQSADKVTQLRQRLAQLRGDEVQAQELRNQQELLQLQQQLAEAKRNGSAEEIRNLEEALRLQKKINDEELKRVKQQEENNRRSQDSDTSNDGGGGGGGVVPTQQNPLGNVVPLNLQREPSPQEQEQLRRQEQLLEREERLLLQRERDLNRNNGLGVSATPQQVVAALRTLLQQQERFKR